MLRISHNQRGWVFIDALIGMVIVALALTALAMAYFQATSASTSANNNLRALYIAQAELEALKRFDRQSYEIAAEVISLPAERQVTMPDYSLPFTVRVQQVAVSAVNSLAPRLVPVQVTVTWQEQRGGTGQVQMTGYYYQPEREQQL